MTDATIPMSPADVPDELVKAALKTYCAHCALTVGRQPMSDHEEEARTILAAALPLAQQQVCEGLAADVNEARELAQVSLDILRNISDEPLRELFGVDDMGEFPEWFTRYERKTS